MRHSVGVLFFEVSVQQPGRFTDATEDLGDGLAAVEIVVHRQSESFSHALQQAQTLRQRVRAGHVRMRQGNRMCGGSSAQGLAVGLDEAPVVALRVMEQGLVHVDGRAVMRVDERKAEHERVHPLEDVADGPEIAERLAHLLAVHVDEAVVQPVVHQRGVVRMALALEDLGLVVWEAQVVASAVDVEGAAKAVEAHRGAFDVPTWSALAPRGRPRWLARLGRFPQGEITVVALATARAVNPSTRAGTYGIEALPGQLTVFLWG